MHYSEKVLAGKSRGEFLEGLVFRALHRLSSDRGRKNLAVFSMDPIGLAIVSMGVFEKDILEFVMSYLNNQGLVRDAALDIGANIGNHSIFFSDHYASVESFEPHPVTFQLLRVNSRLGRGISVHNVGASDMDQMIEIYNEPHSLGGASLHPHREDPSLERHQILLRPLDSMPHLQDLKIGLMKIDVEGHELRVLKGAAGLIARSKPVVLFEQHTGDFDAAGRSEVIECLKSMSYSRFAIIRRDSGAVGRGMVSRVFGLLRRVAFGYSMRLDLVDHVPSGFYPAILAMP